MRRKQGERTHKENSAQAGLSLTPYKEDPEQNIIQLMGKESKKQARKTHQAITAAFKGEAKSFTPE